MDPAEPSPGSIMPSYPAMASDTIDFDVIASHMSAMKTLGVPYTPEEIDHAADLARKQAQDIGDDIEIAGGPRGLQDKEMVAIIAYLMRLGVDGEAAIQAERTAQAAPAPAAAPAAGGN